MLILVIIIIYIVPKKTQSIVKKKKKPYIWSNYHYTYICAILFKAMPRTEAIIWKGLVYRDLGITLEQNINSTEQEPTSDWVPTSCPEKNQDSLEWLVGKDRSKPTH